MYNEYIQHKEHIHMNSTKWLTLSEYVKYLGREGFCKVEDTPKGWFISVIHRDVEQVRSTSPASLLPSQLRQSCLLFLMFKPFRAFGPV